MKKITSNTSKLTLMATILIRDHFYVLHSSPIFYLDFHNKRQFTSRVENSVDPDQYSMGNYHYLTATYNN